MPSAGQRPPVGVLVVHGIGAQKRGETLAKLWNGLRRVYAGLPETPTEGQAVTLGDRSVRFYEVYWADLLMGERVKGSFNMNEMSSLAWFPLFNHVRRAYADEPYPLSTVLRWTIVLPLVGFAVLMTYWGARLLAQLYAAIRHRPATTPAGLTFVERVKYTADQGAHMANAVDAMLDEFAADVFSYVNSAGDSFPEKPKTSAELRGVYRQIVERFYERLKRARDDGCESLQVVAHSLGTVVTYHALRGLRFDVSFRADGHAVAEACTRVEHIYTIGSPLEKIRFFWPRLRPTQNLAGERPLAWDNFVSYFDPVAGVLRRYREWGEVRNHHLLGGGFLSGHVVYERSAAFLEAFTQGLVGEPATLHGSMGQRIKDYLLLLGETLLAPVGLLLLVVVGAGLWVFMAALLPFLASLPFRPFYPAETWGPIVDYATLTFGAMFLFVLLVVPLIDASRSFSRLRGDSNNAAAGG